MPIFKSTPYFENSVRPKRPYILLDWCLRAITDPDEKVLQTDGRIRYYKHIPEVGKFIRVITLEDGETIHNVFYDRRYKPKEH